MSTVQNSPSMRNGPSRVQIASMMSIASSIIFALPGPTPNSCPSVGKEPGAKPAMYRPPVMWSRYISRCARAMGLWYGRRWAAAPRRSRTVSRDAAAIIRSGAGLGSVPIVLCSAKKSSSNPYSSAHRAT